MENKKHLTIALISLILPSLFAFCYFVAFPDPPVSRIFYGTSRAFFILFPVLWIVFGDKKKFPLPRFKKDGMRAGVVSGLCIGITILVLYINVFKDLLDVSKVTEKADQLGFGGNMFIVFAIFLIIANSSLEEYYWRWFGFSKLREVFSLKWAIFLSGFGFMLHHVIVLVIFFGWLYGIFFGAFVGIGGCIWVYFYHKYDSIWPCWISHAIIDAALMFIGFDMLFC